MNSTQTAAENANEPKALHKDLKKQMFTMMKYEWKELRYRDTRVDLNQSDDVADFPVVPFFGTCSPLAAILTKKWGKNERPGLTAAEEELKLAAFSGKWTKSMSE